MVVAATLARERRASIGEIPYFVAESGSRVRWRTL